MSSVSTLYCITGLDDINALFRKFKDPNEKMFKKQYEAKGSYPSIKVCYSKIDNRASFVMWTNGNVVNVAKIPSMSFKINDNFLDKYGKV